ncbi:response regulator [Rhizophagus clarus]|uniref:Response regulator n=1 Tax=Rhizophagus clarus TaxID=94130 RepID=A0A8H3M8U1_9GLOM|nr:response regulator [Rhizophagus clarus]
MTKIINRILPAKDSQDDIIPLIDERFSSRVVIFIMTMQMFSVLTVITFYFWRTSELVSDIYFDYYIVIGLIYAETIPMSRSRLFLLPPFSYFFAGRKFGILTGIITFNIYILSVFLWQSSRTIQFTLFVNIFHFVLDLIVPILILSLLSVFVNERVFDTKNTDRQIEEAQSKAEFLRIVSHELRTPIHGILASTEILRESQLTSAQRSLNSAIQSAGENVIHIADHILRISGKRGFEQQSEQFDLFRACDQISEGMSPLLESQNFDFEFDYQVPLSQSLFIGDIGVLKQIIINSMNNMSKIILNGKLIFTIKAKDGSTSERTDKLSNLFTIEFKITGIGHILDDCESSIEADTELSVIYPEYYNEFSGIKLTRSLVDLIGGDFEIKKSPKDLKSHKSSYVFIITVDLQRVVKESDRIIDTKPIPSRYVTEVGNDPKFLLRVGIIQVETHEKDPFIIKKIEATLIKDFEMKAVQRISIEEIDNERVNTIIFDTSEFEEQIIEKVCQKAKNANVVIIFITQLLRTAKVNETASKSGVYEDKLHFIINPLTQVKLWNGLIAATNKIKTESDEVIQKEEGY